MRWKITNMQVHVANQKMRLCLTKLLGLKIALGNARGHACTSRVLF